MGRRWTVARWRCSWCIFVVLPCNRFYFISYMHLTCSSFLDCYQFLSLSALQQDRLLLEYIKISKQTKLRITRPSPVIGTMVEIQNLVLDSWSKARTFLVNQKASIEYISPGKSIPIKNWRILKYITSKTKNVDQYSIFSFIHFPSSPFRAVDDKQYITYTNSVLVDATGVWFDFPWLKGALTLLEFLLNGVRFLHKGERNLAGKVIFFWDCIWAHVYVALLAPWFQWFV